jgi:hypothetical protein
MRTSDSTTTFDKNLFTVRPSGYVGINTTDPNCHLTVAGIANIHNGSPYATANNAMQSTASAVLDSQRSKNRYSGPLGRLFWPSGAVTFR